MTQVPIENENPKRFRLCRLDSDGNPFERVGEYDTIEEVLAHSFPRDSRYEIQVAGEMLTPREFQDWAKQK